MKHTWFQDESFIPGDTHIVREICVNCDELRYWWLRKQNGEVTIHSYVMRGNTQFGDTKCNGFVNRHGFHPDKLKPKKEMRFVQQKLF